MERIKLLINFMIAEKSLVVFKPDVIQRQIVGELLTRFERKGFKVVAMKMIKPSKELVGKHYSDNEDYLRGVGDNAITSARERGETMQDISALDFGKMVRNWNIEYLSCGPVVAMVFEGAHVIEGVRKILGSTNPIRADIGSIRADYTPDSYLLADAQGRTARTLVHASDSPEEAEREIKLWFSKDEIFTYETAIEKILYDTGWTK